MPRRATQSRQPPGEELVIEGSEHEITLADFNYSESPEQLQEQADDVSNRRRLHDTAARRRTRTAAAAAIQTCPEASTLARFNSVVLHLLTRMTHAI